MTGPRNGVSPGACIREVRAMLAAGEAAADPPVPTRMGDVVFGVLGLAVWIAFIVILRGGTPIRADTLLFAGSAAMVLFHLAPRHRVLRLVASWTRPDMRGSPRPSGAPLSCWIANGVRSWTRPANVWCHGLVAMGIGLTLGLVTGADRLLLGYGAVVVLFLLQAAHLLVRGRLEVRLLAAPVVPGDALRASLCVTEGGTSIEDVVCVLVCGRRRVTTHGLQLEWETLGTSVATGEPIERVGPGSDAVVEVRIPSRLPASDPSPNGCRRIVPLSVAAATVGRLRTADAAGAPSHRDVRPRLDRDGVAWRLIVVGRVRGSPFRGRFDVTVDPPPEDAGRPER